MLLFREEDVAGGDSAKSVRPGSRRRSAPSSRQPLDHALDALAGRAARLHGSPIARRALQSRPRRKGANPLRVPTTAMCRRKGGGQSL